MGLFDKLLGKKGLGKIESAREERGEYYFVISYVINYLRAEVSAAATELTELNILEKAKALSYEGLGKNLLLIISKGSQDLSDDAVNSFSKQYEEYCQLFEKITGGKAYACYINWKPYSAKAATKTTAAWDTISYVMPVEDGTVWKNNMQVFHVFFKDALTKLPRR